MIALTYDDIQLIPAYSDIASRMKISLQTQLTRNHSLDIPIVASPMGTVCEYDMAAEIMDMGGVGCIHRFLNITQQAEMVLKLKKKKDSGSIKLPIMAAVGANGDFLERAVELVSNGADVILIDVAHGHHKNVKDAIAAIKGKFGKTDVIAGNIATAKAASDLQDWGADALRVGVGGGSLCTTRIKTGFGIPNVTCLQEVMRVATVPVIADGGIRSSGDISKALALGSSTVMLGSLLAGTEESPGAIIPQQNGLFKKYSGAASFDTKVTHGQETRNIEGESTIIAYKGKVKLVLNGLLDGVRSALSYAGAHSLKEYHPEFMQVTTAGLNEAKPHLL